jgi:hypothetical protein
MPTKKDRWEEIIDRLHLDVAKSLNILTATDIKTATREVGMQEEPRIMAAMYSEAARPDVFRRNGLFLLPVARGRYALVRGSGFCELEDPGEAVAFSGRTEIPLQSLEYGKGESRYLLHAYHSGLLSHFTGIERLYPTVLGKMGSGDFAFRIGAAADELLVEGAGMEIDLGLEGEHDILLIEGKVSARPNFLIRQLYYPFRAFRDVTDKKIRSIFFVAEPETNTYALWEYWWPDYRDYEGIRLCKKARYRLAGPAPPIEPLDEIQPDPSLGFVLQADTLATVRRYPKLVAEGFDTAQAVAAQIRLTDKHFNERQGLYYSEAAEAFGLITRDYGRPRKFRVAQSGRQYLSYTDAEQDELLKSLILRNPVLNRVFHLALERSPKSVRKADVVNVILELSSLNPTTANRRSGTVFSYLEWLGGITGRLRIENGQIFSVAQSGGARDSPPVPPSGRHS